MKISMSKIKLATLSLLLLATIALPLLSIPAASAHTPAWQVPTYAYITASPNPVGPNQQTVFVFWMAQPPPSASAKTGDRWTDMTIDVTKPDGTIDHLGPFVSDPVGSGYTTYTPQVIGTYTAKFNFPQQVCERAGYTGLNGSNSAYVNDTFLASTASTKFVVQATPIAFFTEAPLPVSYWTRPIDSNNQNWASIGGAWLGQNQYGATYLKYNPNGGWAPNTAHVMWTLPISYGGIVGQGNQVRPDLTFYSGTAYQLKFSNPLIMYGTVFFSLPVANSPSGSGVTAVDLRTGETKWTRTDINSVSYGQLLDFESPNQHGVNPNGYLWYSGTVPNGSRVTNPNAQSVAQLNRSYAPGTSVGAVYSGTSVTINSSASAQCAIDPMTGQNVFNETNVPSGTRGQGPMGEWLLYGMGQKNSTAPFTFLWQWNNTKYPGQDSPTAITAWGGSSNYNMSAAYDWNVTLSMEIPDGSSIVRLFPGNYIFGTSTSLQQTSSTSSGVFGTPDPFTLWAINLNATRGQIGQVLFLKNYPAPAGNLTVLLGPDDGETNVFTLYYRETMQWSGYSVLDGSYLWGPTAKENNWNYYGGTTGLTAPYAIGYGHLYSAGYSGTVYCYDFKTGKLEFTYGNNASDPFNSTITQQTVYGVYPEQIAGVVDGKIYMVPCEHSLDSPPYHGANVRCIDAFTGKEQFTLYGMSSWQMQAIADGYWTFLNLNDMQIYSIGAGPSATTVNVQNNVVALGGAIEITGTVLDQSPALKGTPAISDADQGPWMQYMIQHNVVEPANAVGVPVTLYAIDSNGNTQTIGTVTSTSGGIFHKLWTPQIEGEYVIIAKFEGTQSYGPSSAQTAIGVTAAPSPVVTPTPTPVVTATPTPIVTASPSPSVTTAPSPSGLPTSTIYAIAAAVIIIVIVAVAAIALKRRK